ncbi:MAG: TIGR01459 family HAD-type hydrolase [Bdellovibrionales bacterium]|jgi:HAD superfamily hydrolase (TIGR01459 family)|nr:TIGR01459 family HAD-type hydrolase [Bdellovibrionales bacterium]
MNSPTNKTLQFIDGIGEIAGFYEGYILDLWGVVHDGEKVFPDTVPTLRAMKRAKRHVWLLSNAPRRAYTVAQKMAEMGVTEDLYDGIMTSGEATWQALQDRYLQKWGKRCFHIGGERDHSLFEDMDVELVASPEQADFVLCSGIEDFSHGPDVYRDRLAACAARRLPMICANPDRIVHVGEKLVICAGTLADIYIEMEGDVTWFGKPYRQVYSHCLAAMPGMRVLGVGDAMPTDIAGATGAGIDSILVTGGIHRENFEEAPPRGGENHFEAFFSGYPYRPSYLARKLYW